MIQVKFTKLTIFESLQLIQILPAAGNILTLRVIQDLKRKIEFSAKEQQEYGLKHNEAGSKIVWEKEHVRDFDFEEKELEVISKSLKALDEKEALTMGHMSLWEKFIEKKEVK